MEDYVSTTFLQSSSTLYKYVELDLVILVLRIYLHEIIRYMHKLVYQSVNYGMLIIVKY